MEALMLSTTRISPSLERISSIHTFMEGKRKENAQEAKRRELGGRGKERAIEDAP